MNYQKLYEKYIIAKTAYYEGNPIMSDFEFDTLEKELKNHPEFKRIVGFDNEDRNAKFTHPSKMLSLDKIQAEINGGIPTTSFLNWANKIRDHSYFATPKFDGNAVNLIYKNGQLDAILSRGNGTAGRDYSEKMKNRVPQSINTKYDTVEVRGEVVIATEVFEKKYSQYKNERNFVAGILNRDEDVSNIIKDFDFLAVEIRLHDGDRMIYQRTAEFLFEQEGFILPYEIAFDKNDFELTYTKMLEYRTDYCPYRLDGFVIKTSAEKRADYGENSHHPEWAIAIKFPPEEALTEIKEIRWNFGKTGELTPIAIMNTVYLDGTSVSRATIHNFGWLTQKGCAPGAKVIIAKKGDIIPQIISVYKPSTQKYFHPHDCPHCNTQLEIKNNLHLYCPNQDCEGKNYKLFQDGFLRLGLYGIGPAVGKKLWDIGFTSPIDILDKEQFNKDVLIESGEFKEGRSLEILINAVNQIKEISLRKIILMMGIENLGGSTATQIANKIAGIEYSYSGLQKDVVQQFEVGNDKYELLQDYIKSLKENDIKIIYPKEALKDVKGYYELTGSPSKFGFKTKAVFNDHAKKLGYMHAKLNKDCNYLITDNLNSNSSKMKKAKKLGVEIITYDQLK